MSRSELGNLPEGWRWVRLGDVCQQDRKIIEASSEEAKKLLYLSLEYIESQTGKILRNPESSIEDEGKSTTFAFDSRHILYGKLRPYLNKVALPNFEGRCTTEAIPLLPDSRTDRHFIAWILRRKETVDAAMKDKTGSRMPRANMYVLFNLKIPLPPLPEQRRIAAILNEQMTSVEKARAAAEAQREAAKALTSANLKKVFEAEEMRTWPRKKLGHYTLKIGSGLTPLGGQASYKTSGILLIRSQNVLMNQFRSDGLVYISKDQDSLMVSSRVIKGDILLNITGASIGRVCVVPDSLYPANVNQHVSIIRCNDKIVPQFLSFYLSTPSFQKIIMASQAGATRQALTKSDIEQFNVPIPSLEIQDNVINRLNSQKEKVETIYESIEKELETIKSLPAALLRQAFSGEI